MNFDILKDIIKKDPHSKYIVIENGKPTHVMLSLEEYARMLEGAAVTSPLVSPEESVDASLVFDISDNASSSEGEDARRDFKLEDLPF